MSRPLSQPIFDDLKRFKRIGLEEFGDNRFTERIDRKFPISISEISAVIEGLEDDYDLITPADQEISTIESHYFDTPDYAYFKAHHRGRGRRHKVRFRVYPQTQSAFLEVKRKTPKGKTLKRRIKSGFGHSILNGDHRGFLTKIGISESHYIMPVVEISYKRLSFISKDQSERFSVDFAVEFSDGDREGNFGSMAVIEVKQDRLQTTPIIKKLREMRIKESSMSKYCLSMCRLHPELKANRFKPVLRNLQELIHEQASQPRKPL